MSANLIDDKTLNRLIAAAIKSGSAFAEALHKAANACLDRVDANNDVRPLNRLAEGLSPKAVEALAVWSVKFGKVKFDRETRSFTFTKKAVTADIIAERQTTGPMELIKTQKPREAHVFNLQSEIKKLIDRATKHDLSGKPVELLRQAALAA